VRLRLLVPRRGRRAGLGGLAGLALLAGCGGGGHERPRTTTASPPPVPRFALGVDERNPHLYAPGPQPPPFDRFRDALVALHPSYIRVQVNWSVLQPRPDAPPDFTLANGGCARDIPPCASFRGLRDALEGVRKLGATPVLLVYGTPDWAAQGASGCEPPGTMPFARMPRLDAYRSFVAALAGLARAVGVTPYWSAWNEPNLPIFLNPQRATCDPRAPTAVAARYAQLVRIVAGRVGLERVLVGEASGVDPHTHATGAAELAAALPADLVCGAAAWSQHAYVTIPPVHGRPARAVALATSAHIVGAVEAALAARHCPRPVPIWITETGAGDRPGACPAMAAQLAAWRADPEIRAAFQYSFRDDPLFPVGLADAKLTALRSAYEAWRGRPCPR
jgi:hypothetical protein